MKIIDSKNPFNAPKPSMFLHGLTGGGKSTFASTGGVPMVILFEPKAMSVLLQMNPNAIGLVPESLDDLDQLMVFLGQADKLASKGIDRIVLDSFTELTQALPRWIREKSMNGQVGTLVKLELSEFGSLRDYALAVVKAIQLTGYPSIIIGRSVSKRVGLAESIRPDGAGKSVDELPGKLLPTAEARFDSELGFVIDTTPADHSQRCGLPWVPQIYSGNCLDYLRIIEAGPQGELRSEPVREVVKDEAKPEPLKPPAQATEPKPRVKKGPASSDLPEVPAPGANDPVWVDLMTRLAAVTIGRPEAERKDQVAAWGRAYTTNSDKAKVDLDEFVEASGRLQAMGNAPDPEKDPEGYRKAFADVLTTLQAERKAKGAAQPEAQKAQTPAAQFADQVAGGRNAAKAEDVTELLDLCKTLNVKLACLWDYALEKGGARESSGSKNWFSLDAGFVSRVLSQLKDAQKRTAVISWLHQKYEVPF